MANRKSGILLHPSSLPSAFGVGDFGQAAYTFLDRLAEAKQTLWQILAPRPHRCRRLTPIPAPPPLPAIPCSLARSCFWKKVC